MRLAKNALLTALTMLTLIFAVSAQTLRSPNDDRNTAPTVWTGGPVGGATGLFTIYDGQTLRRGEFTFSAAYSNFDRDPGNADVTQIPVSFQIGLSDNLELFFETDAYKGVKINSPNNLSSFYLPNSQFRVGSGFTTGAAIVLAPGSSGPNFNTAIFRPAGTQPFVQYPYTGGSLGNLGYPVGFPVAPLFGQTGTTPTLGPPRAGGATSNFPGVGSIYGSILPGIVFSSAPIVNGVTAPVVYTTAPTYLPDAPFINRTYGQTAFNTFTVGGKWRLNNVKDSWGLAIVPFYRWTADSASSVSGFNQLQRGASAGGSRGDFGVTLVADSRIRKWLNVSGNVGYVYTTRVKDGSIVLLDRPDELQYGVGLDFPVNKYFQPIGELRGLKYVGGRTPNAFENDPIDALVGFRIYPYRWMSIGAAYRYHMNQQDRSYFEKINFSSNARVVNCTTSVVAATTCTTFVPSVTNTGNLANFATASTDPHGYIVQVTAGRRNKRGEEQVENKFANVDSLDLDNATVMLPCPPGSKSKSGKCSDNVSTGVKTKATDPENDVLTYNYTVSGGRIVGQGANVNWDLSGVKPGTYTITAAVDDGCGFCGKTQTKTITVAECDDCVKVCECPSLSVSGPSGTTAPGDSMTFTANISGGSCDNVTYNWTVSSGTIVEGQGTPVIRVATTKEMANSNVTATFTASGDCLCEDCPRTASGDGPVAGNPMPEKVDEFGAQTPDEIKARLDIINNRISSDPTSRAVIINYGSAAEVKKREAAIRKAIAFRGFDASRYTYVNGGPTTDGSKVKTEFWYVPAGAPDPTPGM